MEYQLTRYDQRYESLMDTLHQEENYENFAWYLETHYHSSGHLLVSDGCGDGSRPTGSVMAYSEVSAR